MPSGGVIEIAARQALADSPRGDGTTD